MSRDDILKRGADLRVDGAALNSVPEPWTLVLAHGAGQGMDSPFMESMARLIAARGLRVVRFEFPYMGEQRRTGVRRPPDRQPRLIAAWHETLDRLADGGLGPERLLIGGKSLGGRMRAWSSWSVRWRVWCVSAIPSTRRADRSRPGWSACGTSRSPP